jgi:hypothetical protein
MVRAGIHSTAVTAATEKTGTSNNTALCRVFQASLQTLLSTSSNRCRQIIFGRNHGLHQHIPRDAPQHAPVERT